jgi:hypothetical protein
MWLAPQMINVSADPVRTGSLINATQILATFDHRGRENSRMVGLLSSPRLVVQSVGLG